jgi:cyanophycin synthetase
VILFSMQQGNELVERWVRRGRKAVVLEADEQGEVMVIRDGRRTMPIGYVHLFPATFDGNARMNVQNAMAAAAAAHAAGAHMHDIRSGLRTFSPSFFQSPGRLNLFDLSGIKVLVDYAHNPAGLRTVGDFVERMTSDARSRPRPANETWQANLRVGVIGTAGDRRDEDIRELGRVAARYFDEIIIREDRRTRGRARGETGALVAEGVVQAQREGARAGSVEVVNDELQAVRQALDHSRPGDLVVVCVDYPEDVIEELEARRARARSLN